MQHTYNPFRAAGRQSPETPGQLVAHIDNKLRGKCK